MNGRLKRIGLCLFSAGLLILAYPRTDWSFLVCFALVPLFYILDGKKAKQAFYWAFLCGFCFFAGTLYWFFYLSRWFSAIAVAGVVLLFLYLALYFGAFGVAYSYFSRQKFAQRLFVLPSVWVVLEYVRAHLFTGFDWASLGHAQYKNLPLIQMADTTGVFGVSFVIVLANVLIKELLDVCTRINKTSMDKTRVFGGVMALVVLGAVFVYGQFRLRTQAVRGSSGSAMRIAVVQANIPQDIKWDEEAWPGILDEYLSITKQAANQNPDLIIWPETSYPGYLWEDKALFVQLQAFVRGLNIPLLVGSVLKEGEDYHNAALLLSEEGEVVAIYRKVHLVPFGEFLPLRSILPFLAKLVNIGDFTPGSQWTTFSAGNHLRPPNAFSVLICFEDTVARLSRKFVREGAGLLVNMTNDAWFGDTRAPFMHLQAAVFRTVENRRGLVRAANTGVSCFIDDTGRIGPCVTGAKEGRVRLTYARGFTVAPVSFNAQKTVYTKFGDIFTILCFGCILMGIWGGLKGPQRT